MTDDHPARAALVAVHLPEADAAAFASSVAELGRLARTLGLDVVATVTQKRARMHTATVIGSGKLAVLKALAGRAAQDDSDENEDDDAKGEAPADDANPATADDDDEDERKDDDDAPAPPKDAPIEVVLVDHDISPSQARNLEKATGVEVMDRTAVILEIFRRHARSRVAKAQVEIVRLQYLVPRLRESGKGRDRQRGGIGGKGAGESALELDRRKIRDRIAEPSRASSRASPRSRARSAPAAAT